MAYLIPRPSGLYTWPAHIRSPASAVSGQPHGDASGRQLAPSASDKNDHLYSISLRPWPAR